MMKKLLLVLGILMFCAGSVFARSMPRWSAFPLSVYLPDAPESAIVKKSFDNWKNNSKYIARFIYKTSNVAQRTAKIKVEFCETLPEGKAYDIREVFSFAPFMATGESGGYFYHVDIKIALKDKDEKPFTKKELSAISLQAIGRALGIPCQSSGKGVMVCNGEYNVNSVTKDDYEALFKVYKKTPKAKD